MVGIPEIGGALGGLKAALDITKGINATASAVSLNDTKIALQSAILEAQSGLLLAQETQTAHLKRIDELEAKIAKLDAWETEKGRYQLKEFRPGTFAYVLKEGDASGEPSHRLCPTCYQEGIKSILQTKTQHSGGEIVECLRCNIKLKLKDFPPPSQSTIGFL